ncbi:hypothetical protein BC828DRAFT_405148 [Blastocladiella britannica]|nr:hypothetical protein BC828DRAFT_405148 [Blastocladiella britannica]
MVGTTGNDPSQHPRGSSSRCGVRADVLPNLNATVPCWQGTVSRTGDPIDDARSWLYNQYEYTYSNAPLPALNFYGYWVPTPGSGTRGESGCVFYEFASDMQIAGRWQPSCPPPSISGLIIVLYFIIGLILLPIAPYVLGVCLLAGPGLVARFARGCWSGLRGGFVMCRDCLRLSTHIAATAAPLPDAELELVHRYGAPVESDAVLPPYSTMPWPGTRDDDWAFVADPTAAPHLRVDEVTGTVSLDSSSFQAQSGTVTTRLAIGPSTTPKTEQDLQYFEVTVGERAPTTCVRVGLSAAAQLTTTAASSSPSSSPSSSSLPRLPGSAPRSIAVDLTSGDIYIGGRVRSVIQLPSQLKGDFAHADRLPALCIGFGIRTSSRTVVITVDGEVVWEGNQLGKLLSGADWRVHPVLGVVAGASHDCHGCIMRANFGGDREQFQWPLAHGAGLTCP